MYVASIAYKIQIMSEIWVKLKNGSFIFQSRFPDIMAYETQNMSDIWMRLGKQQFHTSV